MPQVKSPKQTKQEVTTKADLDRWKKWMQDVAPCKNRFTDITRIERSKKIAIK